MQTILSQLETAFRAAIVAATGVDADPLLSVSQTDKFGDYQSNAAMGLAKRLTETTGQKSNPRTVAEQIKAKLELGELASETSIAGPGFINVRLNPAWLAPQVQHLAIDARVGVDPVAAAQTVVVDYSGPNVAKQMHVGHLRSTIIGDAIARVLEFQGHHVIRQNHIGDWGTQFGMLIAFLDRAADSAAKGLVDSFSDRDLVRGIQSAADLVVTAAGSKGMLQIQDLDLFYKQARKLFDSDESFANKARETVVRLQQGNPIELSTWEKIVTESRRHFQPIYERLNVRLSQTDERGESFYNSMLPGVVADFKSAGIATISEGAVVIFTDGDESPLIIEKSGGGYGYATTDLAAIRYRVSGLRADRIIYVVGAPQSQHFRQVFAAARKIGWINNASLDHAAFGSVLGEDGKMYKTRSGETVKLEALLVEAAEKGTLLINRSISGSDEVTHLVDQAEKKALRHGAGKNAELSVIDRQKLAHAVGIGAVKYADLSKDRTSDYVFSWDKMLSMDGNTGPYLQYAYARIQSIFRRAAERGVEVRRPISATVTLESSFELSLAKHILRFGEIVELVARELKPHHLCSYLYDLATRFSGFFENCPVLSSEEPLRSSRLTLCEATGRVLAQGLELLGIEHPEQM